MADTQKQTVEDLGRAVKQKFPKQFDDVPDGELGIETKKKFQGQFDDFVDMPKGWISGTEAPPTLGLDIRNAPVPSKADVVMSEGAKAAETGLGKVFTSIPKLIGEIPGASKILPKAYTEGPGAQIDKAMDPGLANMEKARDELLSRKGVPPWWSTYVHATHDPLIALLSAQKKIGGTAAEVASSPGGIVMGEASGPLEKLIARGGTTAKAARIGKRAVDFGFRAQMIGGAGRDVVRAIDEPTPRNIGEAAGAAALAAPGVLETGREGRSKVRSMKGAPKTEAPPAAEPAKPTEPPPSAPAKTPKPPAAGKSSSQIGRAHV